LMRDLAEDADECRCAVRARSAGKRTANSRGSESARTGRT
jgi:hypothetical protein